MANDGYAWGWSYRSGTYGWVRDDLGEEEQFTGPGGGASPMVPLVRLNTETLVPIRDGYDVILATAPSLRPIELVQR